METVSKITAEAVRRYFNALFKFGYKNYKDVEKVLVLIHLDELLSEDFFEYLSEEDYNNIMKAFYVLAGSTCMIDYPSFASYDKLFRSNSGEVTPRLDGNGIFRVCEGSLIRTKV